MEGRDNFVVSEERNTVGGSCWNQGVGAEFQVLVVIKSLPWYKADLDDSKAAWEDGKYARGRIKIYATLR